MAVTADGQEMRLQYKDNGFAFIDTNRGFRDTGKWRVEGKNVCTDWSRAPSGCGEARAKGEIVHIRRVSNNEVLMLKPN